MKKIVELFGHSTERPLNWENIVKKQLCIFSGKKCYKIRKSNSCISIGTCTVMYGEANSEAVVICPTRLTDKGQVFTDCFHLLTMHEPGNELHVVPEVRIPGGNVDFFFVSVKNGKVRDFVGIELQTLDTTGSVWPERQRLLRDLGVPRDDDAENASQKYGMNWKMTAKTILVQMHHKVQTFEHINKKLVLVVQDKLLMYMQKEFSFSHLKNPATLGDSMHIHAYRMSPQRNKEYKIDMTTRLSTDADGIGLCLGLQAEARVEIDQIILALEKKISLKTRFSFV
jgi:hypothetical protein